MASRNQEDENEERLVNGLIQNWPEAVNFQNSITQELNLKHFRAYNALINDSCYFVASRNGKLSFLFFLEILIEKLKDKEIQILDDKV